jgi:hypothetical protein
LPGRNTAPTDTHRQREKEKKDQMRTQIHDGLLNQGKNARRERCGKERRSTRERATDEEELS